ncbi:MAG: NHLP leader peptide family RiPP precursor [Nostoc sp.]
MADQTRQSIESKIVARALKDESFKQQLLNNPNVAKAEIEKGLGEKFTGDIQVKVLQETANTAYIVLPYIPATAGLSEEQLEAVASGVNISIPCQWGSITFT